MTAPAAQTAEPASDQPFRVVRAHSEAELAQVSWLQSEIWGAAQISTPTTLLRVISEAGGIVLLARLEERPAGFVYGLVGRTRQGLLYHRSHAAGVLQEFRNQGLGRTLKLAQRKAALAQGLERAVWTFDPSQVANAHFNLRQLRATARVFRPDYYGQRLLALSHGLPTDRLLVEWFLTEARLGELDRIRGRGDLLAVPVPEGLPCAAGADPASALKRQAELGARLQSALQGRRAVVDYDAETRSYLVAELPPSFPDPAEPGAGSTSLA